MKSKLTLILLALVFALNANANITEKQDTSPCTGANCLKTKFEKLQELIEQAKSVEPKDLENQVFAGRCIEAENPNLELAAAVYFKQSKYDTLFPALNEYFTYYDESVESNYLQKKNKRKVRRKILKFYSKNDLKPSEVLFYSINDLKPSEVLSTNEGTQTMTQTKTNGSVIKTYKVLNNVLFSETKVVPGLNITLRCYFYKK